MCDYNTLLALYQYANSQNIDVYYYATRQVKSMVLPDETIVMNTDKIETGTEETVHLAHELGHIETGSFYSIHSEFDLRAKHELRADRRAIKRLIPCDRLQEAVSDGICDLWELAEHFSVTEVFHAKSCRILQNDRRSCINKTVVCN